MATDYKDLHHEYSKKLKKAKIFFASFAFLLLIIICAWPYFFKRQSVVIKSQEYVTQMLNPHYFGMDDKNRPFNIKAENALQVSHEDKSDQEVFKLTKPQAYVQLSDQRWATLTSDYGYYNQSLRELTLSKNVIMRREDGQEYHTEEALIQMKTGHVIGKKDLRGVGPKGNIASKGFEIFDYGQKYIFSGKTKLLLKMNTKTGHQHEAS